MSALLAALEPLVAWVAPLVTRLTPLLTPVFGPGDLELAVPQALLLLPLPLLVWIVLPPYRERVAAVRLPFFEKAVASAGEEPRRGAAIQRRSLLQAIVASLVWILVVLSLARPEWVEPPIEKTESARDLLLAIDLSQSMEARDFRDPAGRRIDRLEAVKQVLHDFIARREGDRIGLVVFGAAAYLQAPFTRDLDACLQLLDETRIGMAGPRTMLGDAIGLGIRLFDASEAEDKVLILLTDGNDTGSRVPPPKAADLAAQRGLTVHTIGIGDPNASGEDRVDMEALGAIARATGGRSFLAQDREGLEGIYAEIDALETRELKSLSYRPRRALFHWPLGAGLLAVFAFHLTMLGWVMLRRLARSSHA